MGANIDILGEVTALALRIVGQSGSALLLPRLAIGADEVLAAGRLAGQVDDVLRLEGDRAVVGHTVHVLGKVAAIRHIVILQSIVALPQHGFAVVAQHVLGAGVVVAEAAQLHRLAGGQALRELQVCANLAHRIVAHFTRLIRIGAQYRRDRGLVQCLTAAYF
ncbi:hypothetical protein M5D96_006017 [Drosophila gunungcola]|uniref:Uncharacterized protein n=1 Tax=Drosophila gunungcola TaxID=103775 RepID=A0A9P9YRG1_9MUSC|nr:hypothetical protein M5D96_006017 [Drosophila gunungcola]